MEKDQQAQGNKDFRHIVRIGNTDLDGSKPIYHALTKIKGVGVMFANLVCFKTKTDKYAVTGNLTNEQIKKLDDFVLTPKDIPSWMSNRRRDYETGSDMHLIGGDIDFFVDNDLKRLKMIKSYRGIRHMFHLPVRGQRTKSNFRKNKGKVTGVKKSKSGKKAGK
ncbi:MAG: 30S ribosomal protein S13 [Candidatus Woesearchaeota archaeon]